MNGKNSLVISHLMLRAFGFQVMWAEPLRVFITPASFPSRNVDKIVVYLCTYCVYIYRLIAL